MNHISEDKLLEYVLETLDGDAERAEIAAHLEVCSDCSVRLEGLQKDIEIISGVQPYRRILRMPNPMSRRFSIYSALRAAAMIIVGIFVGFGASNLLHREPATVSPAYVTLSPPADDLVRHAASDATEISASYYEYIIESRE